MEFKGTKEKWASDKGLIFAEDYFQTHIAVMTDNYNEEIREANAKLIAHSKELLYHVNNLKEELESMLDVKEIPKTIKAGIIQQIRLTEELIKRATE